jgi:hypothetical protein
LTFSIQIRPQAASDSAGFSDLHIRGLALIPPIPRGIRKFIYGFTITRIVGLVDQLEDRLLCKQEAARSNRAQSTILSFYFDERKLCELFRKFRKEMVW